MSKQYEKDGTVMTEHDLIMDNSRKGRISDVMAKRAAKVARMRGMLKAYNDCGCMGSYDNLRLTLKVYLKNFNKKTLTGKPF